MKAITKHLRLLRTERALTQRDVALKANLPLSRYWEIENGYREPTAEDLAGLARAFRVDRDAVLPAAVAEVRR